MPKVIVIGGSNGAGKTTAAKNLLLGVEHCTDFVNADEIARGLSPFNVDAVALQAGKIMLARMRELRDAKATFSFETTMATRSFAPFLKECAARGYSVECHYFALNSPETAIARVKQRVALGGHHVPDDIIRRRFWAGRANFIQLYVPLSDVWVCYDSCDEQPRVIASQERWQDPHITEPELWQSFLNSINSGI